jgi:hypothetical protein
MSGLFRIPPKVLLSQPAPRILLSRTGGSLGRRIASVCSSVILLVLVIPSPSRAWEVSIQSAALQYRYVYASQAGPRGFFGPYNTDNRQSGADLAQLNGWFQRRMLSGTTAAFSLTRLLVFSDFALNKAVALHGTCQIGPFNEENERTLPDLETESVIPDARWTRLWISVATPLGNIFYGKRGFREGCGLQFGNGRTAEEVLESARRTVEILQLETFHGPFTLGLGFYPWRRGSEDYWNPEDQNAAQTHHVLGYVRYQAGNLDAGFGGFHWAFNEGPEAERNTRRRASTPPSSTWATEGWLYAKYSNGRVFLNAEADWYYRTIRYQASQDGTFFGKPALIAGGGGCLFAPRFIESWRYMVEFGAIAGPAKLSVLWSHIPGPDRRHGILIFNQPSIQEADKSAYGVFYPYSLLMAKYYRAGVNSFQDMSDANVLAVQGNYMLASNLDVVASVMHAHRASYGHGWGYIRPDPTPPGPARFGFVEFAERGSFQVPAPAIPETDLGWEVNLGIVWRLIENWDLHVRGAYWQPGRWFAYACVDKSVLNWDIPTSTNNFGVNPHRHIDPIAGLELRIEAHL